MGSHVRDFIRGYRLWRDVSISVHVHLCRSRGAAPPLGDWPHRAKRHPAPMALPHARGKFLIISLAFYLDIEKLEIHGGYRYPDINLTIALEFLWGE